MPQLKMCKNCNRLLPLDVLKCPECECIKFVLVELFPAWLGGEDAADKT